MMPTSAIKQQVVGGKYATVGKDGGEKGDVRSVAESLNVGISWTGGEVGVSLL